MKRRITVFFTVIAILCMTLLPATPVKAAAINELNIYALYLGDVEKGDSVLLESKGQCLLVDIGSDAHSQVIADQLKRIGITTVDILFSHLHVDHTAGTLTDAAAGLELLRQKGITINTLYVPAMHFSNQSSRYMVRYSQLQNYQIKKGVAQIKYLGIGDEIRFGDVTGKVLGPVDTWKNYPGRYTQYKNMDDRYTRYENNGSLAMIFTCGNTKYFTAGDSYSEESNALAGRYGDELRCDIMKLCHHGIGSGNTKALMKAVQPKYSFVPNSGVQNVSATTGKWRSYTSTKRASSYGMCYLIGSEKKTLIYRIADDEITLYQGNTISEKNKMTGWQYLYGADGVNRDHDMFYLDKQCRPLTGIQKIGENYYRFKAGGQMDYGKYSEDGEYLGWKSFSKGNRYYKWSEDGKYAYMSYGATNVDDQYLYFNEKGYQVFGKLEDSVQIVKLMDGYYALDKNGVLTTNDWEEQDGMLYYFGQNGKMLRDTIKKIGQDYYLFDTDGAVLMGNSGTEFYEFQGNTYAVRADGTLVVGKCASVGGTKYCFDQTGVVQKNKMIKIGKKNYYFGEDGEMLCDQNIKINGKTYQCDSDGVMSELKKTVENEEKEEA